MAAEQHEKKLQRNLSSVNFDIPNTATDNEIKEFLNAIDEAESFFHRHPTDREEEDGAMSREQLLAKIREKKEVIEKLRCQPWPMQRKRKTLKLAQKYLERHESNVSRTHLYKEELAKVFKLSHSKKWKQFKRWCANVSIYLIPWESKIKTIESRFGTVVSSYFVFLRWIFWINFMITAIMLALIVIPEALADKLTSRLDNPNKTDLYLPRKFLGGTNREIADQIQVVWDYKGYIAKSALFYGYYSNETSLVEDFNYNLPLSYFIVNLLILGYSFFAILRKMASNARMSKLSSGKTEQYQFAWKLFTGWDFSIGHGETASNAVMANVNKFKEAITDYRSKETELRWFTYFRRVVANMLITLMIAGSTYAIYTVVQRSQKFEKDPDASPLQKNEVPIVVSCITLIYPNIFEVISKLLEQVHPRTALRLQLGRILLLYLLNFYTLIIALFYKMEDYLKLQEEYFGEMIIHNATSNVLDALTTSATVDAMGALTTSLADLVALNASTVSVDRSSMRTNMSAAAASIVAALPLGIPINTLSLFQNYFRNKTNRFIKERLTRDKRQVYGDDDVQYAFFSDTPLNTTSAMFDDDVEERTIAQAVVEHPDYGIVGVDNFQAFLKKNGSSADRANGTTVDVETFPLPTSKLSRIQLPTPLPHLPRLQDQSASRKGLELGDYQKGKASRLTDEDLENLCWETLIGQEICKLVTMDLVMSILSILFVDFFRGLWVRYCNRWWCWNLEIYFPEYGEFKVAENVLHLINNQGMIWLGVFFSPLLPAVNNIKMIILLYIRAWAVVTCNVPATQVFRASRSSNFYLMLLLLMVFLCTLPVGYVIVQSTPSKTCGPFGSKYKYYSVIVDQLPQDVYNKLDYIASPGIVIPVLVLLILVVYFLVSLIRGLREANQDLQKQLVLERTEEKRKIYQMAGKRNELNRASMSLPDTKKVDTSHLPDKEQFRRETWHPKLHLINDLPDTPRENDQEGGSEYSPSLSPYSPATPSHSFVPELVVPQSNGASFTYIPSLKSLPEEGGLSSSSEGEGDVDDVDESNLMGRSKSDSYIRKDRTVPLGPSLASMESDLLSKSSPTSDENTERKEASGVCRSPLSDKKSNALFGKKSDLRFCPDKGEVAKVIPAELTSSDHTSRGVDSNVLASLLSPAKFKENILRKAKVNVGTNFPAVPNLPPPPKPVESHKVLIHVAPHLDSSSETSGNETAPIPPILSPMLNNNDKVKFTKLSITAKPSTTSLPYRTAPSSPLTVRTQRHHSPTPSSSDSCIELVHVVDKDDNKRNQVVKRNGGDKSGGSDSDSSNIFTRWLRGKSWSRNSNGNLSRSLKEDKLRASTENLLDQSPETMI